MCDQNLIKCSNCPLQKKSVFRDLDAVSLEELDTIKSMSNFKKGSMIFNEGSFPKGLFCIQSGKVKITQIGTDGKDQIVHMLNSGDVLGHRAIFGKDEYSCSAYALEDTKICFFPKKPFYNLAENNGKLVLQIAHLLANELKEAEGNITSTAQQTILTRISKCLLLLKDKYGFEKDLSTLNVVLTREELANMAGTTRESAIRSLSKLNREGIILLTGKKIKILDEKKLFSLTT